VALLGAPASDIIPGPLSNNPIGIVCKSQFSLFRPIDELEHLWTIGAGISDISQFAPVTWPNNICTHDMVTFFQALHRMDKHLPQDIKENFQKAIHYQKDPKVLAANLVSDLDSEVNISSLCNIIFL